MLSGNLQPFCLCLNVSIHEEVEVSELYQSKMLDHNNSSCHNSVIYKTFMLKLT